MDSPIPSSICILRLSALGDITHVLPVVRAIQHQWPACAITWIIGQREANLVKDIGGVEFLPLNKRGGEAGWRQLRKRLNGRSFDVLLHMQTSLRANILSTRIKARRRIGWDKQRAREGHRWVINEPIQEHPPQHQVQGFLAFARQLGIKADKPHWRLPISEENRFFAAQVLPGKQTTLLISPCSSHPLRDWSITGYQNVARHAIQHLGMRVIVCGGPSEREQSFGTAIAGVDKTIINFVGKDTLPQLVALLARADIVISPDSGPAHIANALGKPVIGLHAATWSIRSGPYYSLHLCIDQFPQAALQLKNKPAEKLRWGSRIEKPTVMTLINVEQVLEKLELAMTEAQRKNALNPA